MKVFLIFLVNRASAEEGRRFFFIFIYLITNVIVALFFRKFVNNALVTSNDGRAAVDKYQVKKKTKIKQPNLTQNN